MKLSRRLNTILKMTPKSKTIVDIGCDHCYLPIGLIKNKIAQSVIAVDINKKPLQKCIQNTNKFKIKNIKPILSDGLKNVRDDFETIIITGMGSFQIAQIIKSSLSLLKTKTIIIQPSDEPKKIRKFLQQYNLKILDEKIILDHQIYYTIIKIGKNGILIKNQDDIIIGPILKRNKSKSSIDKFNSYLKYLVGIYPKITTKERKQEFKDEIKIINKFLNKELNEQ